jgi:hypothetical protein
MFEMKRLAILALVLVAACTPPPTPAPLVNPTAPDVLVMSTSTVASQDVMPTAPIQPTPTSLPETSGLWLQILSPVDEAVVNTSQVDVIGSAPAGAVISVNDEILIVSSDLQFKTTVSLEDGPNLIEVIASDESGNEMSVLLTITYEP